MNRLITLDTIKNTVASLWANTAHADEISKLHNVLDAIYEDGNSFWGIRSTPTTADKNSLSFDVVNIYTHVVLTCQVENQKIMFLDQHGHRLLAQGCDIDMKNGDRCSIVLFVRDCLSLSEVQVTTIAKNGKKTISIINSLGEAISCFLTNVQKKAECLDSVLIARHSSKLYMAFDELENSNGMKQLKMLAHDLSFWDKENLKVALGLKSRNTKKPFQLSFCREYFYAK